MNKRFFALSMIFLLILACYANFVGNFNMSRSFMFDPVYSLYSDAVNFYFLHGIHDTTLLKSDLLVGSIKSNWHIIECGNLFLAVQLFLMNFFSLAIVIKIVSILLCFVFSILIYRIGNHLYSNIQAIFLMWMLLVYFLTMDSFYGGQGRGFGVCILCLFLLLLVKKKFFLLPILLPFVFLFYPSIIPMLFVMCLLVPVFFKDAFKTPRAFGQYLSMLVISMMLTVQFILSSYFMQHVLTNIRVFQSYKFAQVGTMSGNLNIFQIALYYILNIKEHSLLYTYSTIFMMIVCAGMVLRNLKSVLLVPRVFWLMLLASILAFMIVYPINPTVASRQTVFTIPLFAVVFFAVNIFGMFRNNHKYLLMVLIPFLITFIVLHPKYNDIRNFREFKQAYINMSSLPKDVLIAGYPKSRLIRTIPFFSRRAVFYVDKYRDILLGFYTLEELERRRQELIEALYADSLEKVKVFVRKHKITYFVIEDYLYDNHFIESFKNSKFPEDRQTYAFIKGAKKQGDFALFEFAKVNYDSKLTYPRGEIFVINAAKALVAHAGSQ